jgi:hypothetical protein
VGQLRGGNMNNAVPVELKPGLERIEQSEQPRAQPTVRFLATKL